jgi:ATPase subunit of ABC transporter with duplicated ATPase domains
MSQTQSSINNFTFSYPNSSLTIQNLNLKLNSGDKIALIGSNGVGKTTILNQIWRRSFENDSSVSLAHRKAYFTQHLPKLDFNSQKITENYYDLLLEIFIKDQEQNQGKNLDFYPENFADWIIEIVAEPITDFRADLSVYMAAFRLIPSQLPTQFALLSPGTQKKVLLSILLASSPDLILADELTNHLDKEAIQALGNILERVKTPILLIDHNQSFLQAAVNQYIFIPDNKDRFPIHFKGSYKEFRAYLDELQAQQTSQYNALIREKKNLEAKSDDLQKLARQYSESAKIGAMKRATARSLENLENDPILGNADLSKSVKFKTHDQKGKIKASMLCRSNLKDPLKFLVGQNKTQTIKDFELYQGQRVRISGKNGIGKSTLVKSLFHQLQHGSQVGFDQYVSGIWDIGDKIDRKAVFMLIQVTDYPNGQTLENYLMDHTDIDPYQFTHFLKSLELSKFSLNTFISNLSLGEFIRLQLGVMSKILPDIRLIILDEPGNFLDVFTQKALVEMLDKYRYSLLLITHDDILADEIGFEREVKLS